MPDKNVFLVLLGEFHKSIRPRAHSKCLKRGVNPSGKMEHGIGGWCHLLCCTTVGAFVTLLFVSLFYCIKLTGVAFVLTVVAAVVTATVACKICLSFLLLRS